MLFCPGFSVKTRLLLYRSSIYLQVTVETVTSGMNTN